MVTRSTLLNCTPIQSVFILFYISCFIIKEFSVQNTSTLCTFITMDMLNIRSAYRNWNLFIASPTMVAMSFFQCL